MHGSARRRVVCGCGERAVIDTCIRRAAHIGGNRLKLIRHMRKHAGMTQGDVPISRIHLTREEAEAIINKLIGCELAIDNALNYGGIDGSHHKMWVIDQMLRSLTTENEYDEMITEYEGGPDGPCMYEWDTGISP